MGEVDCCCPTFVAGFLVSIQRDMSVPLLITLAPFLSLDYIIIVSSWPVIDLQVMNESHGGIDAASIKRGPCSTTSTFARDNKRTKYTNHDDNGVCPTLVNVAIHPNGEATQGTPVATARDSAALTDTTNNSQGGTATRGAQHKVATIKDDTTRVSLMCKSDATLPTAKGPPLSEPPATNDYCFFESKTESQQNPGNETLRQISYNVALPFLRGEETSSERKSRDCKASGQDLARGRRSISRARCDKWTMGSSLGSRHCHS